MVVVGLDLGGTTAKLVAVDEDLAILQRATFATDGGSGPDLLVERSIARLEELESRHGGIAGLGLSMAGLVDAQGRVVEAPNLSACEGFDFRAAFRRWRADLVLAFENDVNCAIVGEHRHGAGRGLDHLCMLSLGTGVGGGVILDGRLFHGHGGLAGELGHLVIDLDGPLCTCGKRGHVEAHLSTSAFVARARRSMAEARPAERGPLEEAAAGGDPDPRVLSQCAHAGDALSRKILADSGRYLGAACASLAHAFQPQKIIIGGGVSGAGRFLLDPTREAFADYVMESVVDTVDIGLAELGPESAAVGAARLALDRIEVGNSTET